MINFANLFNSFRSSANSGSSGLADLLKEPGITLARLLEEDTFVSGYKSENT